MTTFPMFHLDNCCHLLLYNIHNFHALYYIRNINSSAPVRQKLFSVPTQSVTLGWGRMSPLRQTQSPDHYVQVQANSGGCPQGLQEIRETNFTEVLLGGKALLKRFSKTVVQG